MWNPLLRAARLSGTSCDWIPLAELRCELVDAVSRRDLIWPLKVHGQVLARGAAMEIYNAELGASSMTMSLGAKPRLLFLYQGFAILMGLASMVAALPVAALSFGCHGAAMFLGRVRPLRDAYEFLSRSYDRVLERLGEKILRDSRDTPALRL